MTSLLGWMKWGHGTNALSTEVSAWHPFSHIFYALSTLESRVKKPAFLQGILEFRTVLEQGL